MEATKWMNYLSCLIKSALVVVEAVDIDAQSTLVHCSDGWDRTPQLVSLAQLLLDPYYRTIKVGGTHTVLCLCFTSIIIFCLFNIGNSFHPQNFRKKRNQTVRIVKSYWTTREKE